MNEVIFFCHIIMISSASLTALWIGKEALTAFIAIQGILANLFVTKTIALWGLTVTVSDAFIVGIIISLQLLQEYYGRQKALQAIWLSFGALLFYTATVYLILAYLPSNSDHAHEHLSTLLSITPRLSIASLLAYICSTQCDSYLYNILYTNHQRSTLLNRTIISALCSQGVDTTLFSIVGLYGIVEPLSHIILFSYIVKVFCITISSPFVLIAKHYIPLPSRIA